MAPPADFTMLVMIATLFFSLTRILFLLRGAHHLGGARQNLAHRVLALRADQRVVADEECGYPADSMLMREQSVILELQLHLWRGDRLDDLPGIETHVASQLFQHFHIADI